MIERGKFRSLTLVNWNGFFARTFDLDLLVTTLSGGNGAGKSTTMAAFVTALIPDLTLLHFRNTTDAGATASGSRDKGLYGKLRAGICYAVIEVINSRQQRILFGVRLQQISSREGKIDLKPFMLQNLPTTLTVPELLTENTTDTHVRVRQLSSLKVQVEAIAGTRFKVFNAVIDYHAELFDQGIIPKRLYSAADRSKFYRLIEASLYGGISSAITRSLRDYLLPENSGVRKAFQDMEAALRENRLTLEAIRLTQSDRDLFKNLMLQATHYVAADYMRQVNQRQAQVQRTLTLRRTLFDQHQQLFERQHRQTTLLQQLAEQTIVEADWQRQYQDANHQLHQVNLAVQQQAKISRYQDELATLNSQLPAQEAVVAKSAQQLSQAETHLECLVAEVDSLQRQLADQQQALDQQQTQAIQYQQALQALEKARSLCQLPDLQPEGAGQRQSLLTCEEQAATEKLLNLTQQLSLAEAAASQFSQVYQRVCQIAGGDVAPGDAWQTTVDLLQQLSLQQRLADTLPQLGQQMAELEQRLLQQQQSQRLWQAFCQQQAHYLSEPLAPEKLVLETLTPERLKIAQQQYEQQRALLAEALATTQVQVAQDRQAYEQLAQVLRQQTQRLPAWQAAQQALQRLCQQCEQPMMNSQAVSQQMQQSLADQQQLTNQRNALSDRQRQLDQQIVQLHQPGGGEESALITLAEQLGGTLLSEIYEDITLEEAPYFSALYGPARQAIVVTDLEKARQQLTGLENTPADLYLIEGDPQAFDDRLFNASEHSQAVIVHLSQRQLRYSRFPVLPLFGRTAREQRLKVLRAERQALEQPHITCSFAVQKGERLQQAFNQFISQHLAIAFEADPNVVIKQQQQQLLLLEQRIQQQQQQIQQQRQQQTSVQQAIDKLNQLVPLAPILLDSTLAEQVATQRQALLTVQQAQHWVQQHAKPLRQLEPLLPILQVAPQTQKQRSLPLEHQQAEQAQRLLKQQLFALAEVVQRAAHFNYQPLPGSSWDLDDRNAQLRQRLTVAETQRQQARQQQQQQQRLCSEALASFKSAYAAKQQLLQELQQELAALQIPSAPGAQQQAQQQCEALQRAVNSSRDDGSQLAKTITRGETELAQLQESLSKLQRDHRQMRLQVVNSKSAWCQVLQLARMHRVEQALHQRALAYRSAEDLRSMSDKALGTLRQAVADDDYLRDALRASEDTKSPLKKVQFYIAVYQHLQQRIRQDILHTHDPLAAIEQMEIELARLTEELTAREDKLTISAKSVASIIHKTIQREQNRIQLLNQGLQRVTFGQVQGVRLVVRLHDSHARLLEALASQSAQHQDLFSNRQLCFSEALAKLYQRLIPQADLGQRSPQTVGEALLDYRHYLGLTVEVLRGSEGWLRAESGTLSTGEAIGTGMAILVMVVQSWEEESARLRGKDILPCRLLFLDEAARLDSQSIATLFELCERLQMQLLIAAPENINPEKGTTYKLLRKVFQQREYVHVIGLRGFTDSHGEGMLPQVVNECSP